MCPLRAQLLCCSLAPGTVPRLPRAAASYSHVPFRLWPGMETPSVDGAARAALASPRRRVRQHLPPAPGGSWSGRPLCRVRVASSCPLCISCCG